MKRLFCIHGAKLLLESVFEFGLDNVILDLPVDCFKGYDK